MGRRFVLSLVVAVAAAVLTVEAPADATPGVPHQTIVLGTNINGAPALPHGTGLSVDSHGDLDLAAGDATRMTPQAVTVFTQTTPQVPASAYISDAAGNGYVGSGSTISVIDGFGNVTHTIALTGTSVGGLALDPTPPDLGAPVIYVLDPADSEIEVIDPTAVDLPAGDADVTTWKLPSVSAASIAIGLDHTIYVGDLSARIWRYSDQGIFLGTVIPSGGDQGGVSAVDGLTIDSAGTMFIADAPNDRIVEDTTSGTYLGMFGSPDTTSGANPGTGQFDGPTGVAVDCLGNLWVLDNWAGGPLSRIVGFTGVAAPTGTCAAGPVTTKVATTQAGLVAVDRADNAFVSSYGRVEKYDAGLHLLTAWGAGESATPGVGHFGLTNGLAVAPNGDVFLSTHAYVTFSSGGLAINTTESTPKVLEFHSNGAFVREFTSEPNAVSGGPASTPFVRPGPIAIRSDGHLFVSDSGLGSIQEFDASLHFVRTLTLAPIGGAAGGSSPHATAIAFDNLNDTVVAVAQRAATQSTNYPIISSVTNIQAFRSTGASAPGLSLPEVDGGGLLVTGLVLGSDGIFDYATATQMPGTFNVTTAGGLLDAGQLGVTAPIAPGALDGSGVGSAVTDCAKRAFATNTTTGTLVVVHSSSTRCIWLPTASTGVMTKHTTSSITVTGSSNPSGQVTKMRVLYGPTTSYGHATAWATLPCDNTVQTRTFTLSGLLHLHTYHYRVQVQNPSGTVNGADRYAKTA